MPLGKDPIYDPYAPQGGQTAASSPAPVQTRPGPTSASGGLGKDPIYDPYAPQGQAPAPTGAPTAAQPAPAASPGQQDIASMSYFNHPANVSWKDIMLARLAQPFEGSGQALEDYARVIGNAPTFGGVDRALAYLHGTDPTAEFAETAAAKQRLGPIMGNLAEMVGYAPIGELGAAAKIGGWAAPYIGRWAGGVLGSALEGTGAGAAGALGHGEDVGQGALYGGLAGGAAGTLGGVVGRGGKLRAAVPISDLTTAKTQAYKDAGDVLYNNADVRDAVSNALGDITGPGVATRVSKEGQGALDVLDDLHAEASGRGAMSAERLNDYLGKLHVSNTGDAVPDAGQIAQGHLQNILDSTVPITGGAPNEGAQAVTNAKQAFGRLEDTQRLADWQTKADVPGGPDVGSQARSYLLSDAGQQFAPSGSVQYGALSPLAAKAGPTNISWAPSAYDLRHALAPVIEGTVMGGVAGGGEQAREGHFDPYTLAGEMAVGGLLGYGAHKGFGNLQNWRRGVAQGRLADAANVALSTGRPQAPVYPDAPFRNAVRNLIFGQGAAGAY